MKVDILAVGAHPDDIELGCGGTLIRHIEQGKTVGLLDLTRGELGTRGSAELRHQEATKSMQLLGAKFRKNVGFADGFFQYNEANLRKIIEVIRYCQPEIVLANAVDDRHIDHGKGAKITADACFLSGLRRIETTNEDGTAQEAYRPRAVYHYIQDYNLTPDFVIDITEYMERKVELIGAFGSQFYTPDSNEPETPLTGEDFYHYLRGKFKTYGRPAGFEYAEGFTVARTPGVDDLFGLR